MGPAGSLGGLTGSGLSEEADETERSSTARDMIWVPHQRWRPKVRVIPKVEAFGIKVGRTSGRFGINRTVRGDCNRGIPAKVGNGFGVGFKSFEGRSADALGMGAATGVDLIVDRAYPGSSIGGDDAPFPAFKDCIVFVFILCGRFICAREARVPKEWMAKAFHTQDDCRVLSFDGDGDTRDMVSRFGPREVDGCWWCAERNMR